MKKVDRFLLFDTAQFLRRGWINRNRIQAPNQDGWEYINLPTTKAPLQTLIQDVKIKTPGTWQAEFYAALAQRYREAPYYNELMKMAHSVDSNEERLGVFLHQVLTQNAEFLGIQCAIELTSTIEPPEWRDKGPLQRILAICKQVGATSYLNLPGGRELYDPAVFAAAGISLDFIPPLQSLPRAMELQPPSDLSILDLVARNGREAVCAILQET